MGILDALTGDAGGEEQRSEAAVDTGVDVNLHVSVETTVEAGDYSRTDTTSLDSETSIDSSVATELSQG